MTLLLESPFNYGIFFKSLFRLPILQTIPLCINGEEYFHIYKIHIIDHWLMSDIASISKYFKKSQYENLTK